MDGPLNRRTFLRTSALAGLGALSSPLLSQVAPGPAAVPTAPSGPDPKRVRTLVDRALVVDLLGLLTLDWPRLYSWQRDPRTFGDADFARLRASGVQVFHPAVEPNSDDPYTAAVRWLAGWNNLLRGRPDWLLRIDAAGDIDRAAVEGKVGLLLGFQNSDHFQTAADVATFHRLGQRISQLTYNDRNRLGSGCRDPRDRGLTPFGTEVVAAMNRAGMAVDLSHCGDRTTLDAIAASSRPVLITHSNCRALVAHPRCKPDAVIRAVAARGGLMGISVIPAFVRTGGAATLEHVLDHFDHALQLVGAHHVALGSDADLDAVDPATGRIRPRYVVHGLVQTQRVYQIAEGLLRRGCRDADVQQILGGNARRVLAAIWGEAPASPPTVA
jgi:membrane dipeptidase